MTTRIDVTDVARQIARMWPHARMHVAPTPMGHAVVLGATAAELTPDWWTVRKPDQADRFWGYVECDGPSSQMRLRRRTRATSTTRFAGASQHSTSDSGRVASAMCTASLQRSRRPSSSPLWVAALRSRLGVSRTRLRPWGTRSWRLVPWWRRPSSS